MIQPNAPLLILIAGPYFSGTNGDQAKIAANRARLESYAQPIYARGHLPMISEWMALPIIHASGEMVSDDATFTQNQYLVAQRLLRRCDAVLRIVGASRGADGDVAFATALGLTIYHHVDQIPLYTENVKP
jgi:hypothetical protein